MSNKNNELNFLSYLEDGKETTQKNISNNISVSIGFINALIKKFKKRNNKNKASSLQKIYLLFNTSRIF